MNTRKHIQNRMIETAKDNWHWMTPDKPDCIRAGIRVSPILYPPVQTTDGNDAGGISQMKVVPVQRFQGVPDYMLSNLQG